MEMSTTHTQLSTSHQTTKAISHKSQVISHSAIFLLFLFKRMNEKKNPPNTKRPRPMMSSELFSIMSISTVITKRTTYSCFASGLFWPFFNLKRFLPRRTEQRREIQKLKRCFKTANTVSQCTTKSWPWEYTQIRKAVNIVLDSLLKENTRLEVNKRKLQTIHERNIIRERSH